MFSLDIHRYIDFYTAYKICYIQKIITTRGRFQEYTRKIKNVTRASHTKKIAKAIGVSRATYSHLEKGRKKLDTELTFKLANYHRISIDSLLDENAVTGLTDLEYKLREIKERIEKLPINQETFVIKQVEFLLDNLEELNKNTDKEHTDK